MEVSEYQTVIKKIDRYILGILSPSRYEHSCRVAQLCKDLSQRFGVNPFEGYLSGIAHDMCKSSPERLIYSLAKTDGLPFTDIEENRPSLLHGRAAAVMMEADFGVHAISVLDAVRHHTFGYPRMDALGLIVFVADKIEIGRIGIDASWREKVLESNLEQMAMMVVTENIRYLTEKGKEVSPSSKDMLESLKGRKNIR